MVSILHFIDSFVILPVQETNFHSISYSTDRRGQNCDAPMEVIILSEKSCQKLELHRNEDVMMSLRRQLWEFENKLLSCNKLIS